MTDRQADKVARADQEIRYVTQVLEHPIPDLGTLQDLHSRRLYAVFLEGKRPDLPTYLRTHPVWDWLVQAQSVDITGAGAQAESELALAEMVAVGWDFLLPTLPLQDRKDLREVARALQGARHMLDLVRKASGVPEDRRLILAAYAERFANMCSVIAGDGEVDFSAIRRLLENPHLTHGLAYFAGGIAMLFTMAGATTGALAPIDAASVLLRKHGKTPLELREAKAAQVFVTLYRSLHTRFGGVEELVPRLQEIVDLLAGESVSTMAAPLLTMAEGLLGALRPGDGSRTPGPESTTGIMSSVPSMVKLRAAVHRGDVAAVREVCEEVDRLISAGGTGRHLARYLHGFSHYTLALLDPGDGAAVRTAIAAYEEMIRDARADRDPNLHRTVMPLATLLRRRDRPGDRARSRALGLESLRGAAWGVLVQSGTAHALEMARGTTALTEGSILACLQDNALEDLVTIIDAGRSLVLESVGTGRTVTSRLTALGHHELARQWSAADGRDEHPVLPGWDNAEGDWGALRRKVLRVLADETDDLLRMPSLDDIRDALREHDSHMLVYLLGATESFGGIAVVVPVEGNVKVLSLPELKATALAGYVAAHDAEPRVWRAELQRVCEWGWQAAGKALLKVARNHAEEPQVVLVPVGELGLVPWHATYRLVDGVKRYLLHDMAVSYAPSARLFCDVIARPEVDAGDAVLVGNPARDLSAGIVEAKAVRDAFYPAGALMGSMTMPPRRWQPAEHGGGTPAEVLAALRAPLPLLHLACHAFADMRNPLRSSVLLAVRGVEKALSAKELLDLDRTNALPVGVVTLAGCTTNVSGADYDEALSLSPTLLAIGARTVIGSLWRVPSGQTTTQLMFMFHRYVHNGHSAADALRRAQLWMLDPDRECPDAMPRYVRDMPPTEGYHHADIECWAGFTQQGR